MINEFIEDVRVYYDWSIDNAYQMMIIDLAA